MADVLKVDLKANMSGVLTGNRIADFWLNAACGFQGAPVSPS